MWQIHEAVTKQKQRVKSSRWLNKEKVLMLEFKTKEIRSLTPFPFFQTEAGVQDISGLKERSFTWPFIDFSW